MELLDWIILFGTLLFIVAYGTWKTRQSRGGVKDFLGGSNDMSWFTIGVSVMATQASAITFLSAPGLGYESGLRFVQFYFGLPIALIIISGLILPIYYRLRVLTAYEYLEERFDLRMRLLTAFLFLVQRGLAAGLTIFAPAIILSTLLGWDLNFTNLFVGALVIVYTVSGGSKAVSLTQKWQMGVIMLGLVMAFILLLNKLSGFTNLSEAINLAGAVGRMEIIDLNFDFNERYTLWSGLTGGLFLALSYFGTDQSQVQRYLGGKSLKESRLGLMFNALVKIPMQFFILFIGVLVFVFYLYVQPPLFFNKVAIENLKQTEYASELSALQARYDKQYAHLQKVRGQYEEALQSNQLTAITLSEDHFKEAVKENEALRTQVKELLLKSDANFKVKDTNYVFLTFVMDFLPVGVVGLIIALIFSAAMSSTSSELNALATTTSVDFYQRLINPNATEHQQLKMSKWFTVGWGILAIGFALTAKLFDNLIEMVNLLGSLFYGTILGIFLVAFFIKKIRGKAIFYSALLAEACVLTLHFGRVYEWSFLNGFKVEYLWYNLIGCALVLLFAFLLNAVQKNDNPLAKKN
jgi:Na+/proline symporter